MNLKTKWKLLPCILTGQSKIRKFGGSTFVPQPKEPFVRLISKLRKLQELVFRTRCTDWLLWTKMEIRFETRLFGVTAVRWKLVMRLSPKLEKKNVWSIY